MLDSFRDNARSWLIQVIIGAVSVVFIFSFGPGSRGCRGTEGPPAWAAKVNGAEVPARTFIEAYRQRIAMLQSYGFKDEDLKNFKVRENIMKEVVNDELLAQAAEKDGVFVSDEELAKAIEREFTVNGTFQEDRYRRYLAQDKSFEARVRRSIQAQRMRTLAQSSVTVSDEDVRAAFLKDEEAASVTYVRFTPAQFADKVQVTDADVDQVLASKKDDIQKKYEANRVMYVEPHAIKARRLFVQVKANAPKEEEDAAKKKIDDALAQLNAGKSWDDVAATLKDAAGGQATDLGFVALGQSTFDRSTEEAIFKLKPGERSGVIRAPFGYEILEAQEDRPAQEKKLETVQRDIAKDIARDQKQKDLAVAAANEALKKLQAGESLETQFPAEKKADEDKSKPGPLAAISAKPEAKTTEEFHPSGGVIGQLGSVPKVSEAAFSLSANKRVPDHVIEDQNAYWVIELKSRKRADMSKLTADKKDEIREKLKQEKQREMMEAWVEQLRKDSKIEENPSLLSYERVNATTPDEG